MRTGNKAGSRLLTPNSRKRRWTISLSEHPSPSESLKRLSKREVRFLYPTAQASAGCGRCDGEAD